MGFNKVKCLQNLKCLIGCILVLSSLGLPVHAESEHTEPRRSIEAVFVDIPPVIDGTLNDPCWQRIAFQGDFQRHDEPDRGGPARVDTAFAIAYDTENLYVGVVMHGDDPNALEPGTAAVDARGPFRLFFYDGRYNKAPKDYKFTSGGCKEVFF
ncbi:MAG TPA: hypothetical protein PLV45_13415, partial [bacterium]|nr:hypothetical protein [bacterium]